jgi:mRNA-degrading endonuclease toxin of MazEF toxin-antitoxin module
MKPGMSSPAVGRAFPRRGEIYWLALDPTVGREIRKTRPALVVSPDERLLTKMTTVDPQPALAIPREIFAD